MSGVRSSHWPHTLVSLLVLSAVTLAGCRDQAEETTAGFNEQSRHCLSCHSLELDPAHRFDCLTCHIAVDQVAGYPEDHPPVLAAPAHPDRAAELCGTCHSGEIEMVAANDHYLLTDHIALLTEAFGAPDDSPTPPLLAGLSSYPAPHTGAQLAQDLLTRRCLRCHVYDEGDDFSAVARGVGCAACHLLFADGTLKSHRFTAQPDDGRCLSCHYANHVGFDFYGYYEHDLNEEYRTPYLADTSGLRPYGVEHHQLAPDVHRQAGMVCIDCHLQDSVMGSGKNPACSDCHQVKGASLQAGPQLQIDSNDVVYTSASTGEKLLVPQLQHPAHERYGDHFSCQTCHAQWTFNDRPTHLLRIDHEEFDEFYKLGLDGSSEVVRIISSHILEDGELFEPAMTNKLTGENEAGIWFRGFGERRWEQVLLGEDSDGTITTVRPILDLRLSWIDEYEESRFDNLEPVDGVRRVLPYVPHTTGKAGLFYEERIRPYLDEGDSD